MLIQCDLVMSSCLPMDVLGVTKSILSGNDSHSWIQSILMTEDDKRKLISDIDKLLALIKLYSHFGEKVTFVTKFVHLTLICVEISV